MRKKISRKIFSIFLATVMILAGTLPVFAEATPGTAYTIWVAGQQFTDSNLTISDGSGGTAVYDPAADTLTLTNFNWSGDGYNAAAIYADGDLNLVLVGSSSVTQTSDASQRNCGTYSGGILTISGSGSLTSTGAKVAEAGGASSYGVLALNGIIIKSGNLTGFGGQISPYAYSSGPRSTGVATIETITVLGGTLAGHGGKVYARSGYGYSYGISAYDGISVSNGCLTGTAKSADLYSIGIYVNGSGKRIVLQENSHIQASGEDYAVYQLSRADGYYRHSSDSNFRKGFSSSETFLEFITKDHADLKIENDHANHTLNCKGDCALKINEQQISGTVRYSGKGNEITKSCSFCGEVGNIILAAPTELTYDGNSKPVSYSESGELATSFLIVKYKNTSAGSDASSIAPTDAGTYEASVIYPVGDTSYTAAVTYEILRQPLTITAHDQDIIYGDSIAGGTGQVTVDTLAQGFSLTDISLSGSTKDVPGGTVTPSGAIIENSSREDVTSNFDITYVPGTLTITEKEMTAEASGYTGSYDGETHSISVIPSEADAVIRYGTAEGVYDLDAAPAFSDAGEYTVYYQVTKPNFTTVTGSATVSIAPLPVNVFIVMIDDQPYTGSAITPEVLIIPENGKVAPGETLVPGTDYTVSYSDNIDAGTATITLGGVEGSNYVVSGSGIFQIVQAENEWVTEPSVRDWVLGETVDIPVPAAKFGETKVTYIGTTASGDTYSSDIPPSGAGSYTVSFTVEETENYSGLSTELHFKIVEAVAVGGSGTDGSPSSGDESGLWTFAALLVVSGSAIIGALGFRRKRAVK